jgi:hypothetical protein
MSESVPPPGGLEQRRSPRYPVPKTGGPVSVVGAKVVNVSSHGLLIESLVAMEAGASLPLRLVILGEKVDVNARVAQCVAAQGEKRRVFKIGLEFVSLPADARERLAEALKPLPAPTS